MIRSNLAIRINRLPVLIACLLALVPWNADAGRVGVVLVHGKQGAPDQYPFAYIAQQLRNGGFVVDQPTMCWSGARIYDQTLPDCMADIDASIIRLKNAGATSIVVAGHSLGGIGAIYYGSTHDGLAGIVAMAPAPPPAKQQNPLIVESLKEAREAIAAGQGDVVRSFADVNNGPRGFVTIEVRATPTVLLSFLDTSGPVNYIDDASRLKAPVLWISGTRDSSQVPKDAGFDKAYANPANLYVQVDAGHMDTPDKAANQVVDWIKALPQN